MKGFKFMRNTSKLGLLSLLFGVIILSLSGTTPLTVNANAQQPGSSQSQSCTHEDEIFSTLGKAGNPINVSPPQNSTVAPGQTLTAYYADETAINNTLHPTFTVDSSPLSFTVTAISKPSGGQKYNYAISAVVPNGLSNGAHNFQVTAWDGDQNKCGGDYGVAAWTEVVTNPTPNPTPNPPSTPTGGVLGVSTTVSTPDTGAGGAPAGLLGAGLSFIALGLAICFGTRRKEASKS